MVRQLGNDENQAWRGLWRYSEQCGLTKELVKYIILCDNDREQKMLLKEALKVAEAYRNRLISDRAAVDDTSRTRVGAVHVQLPLAASFMDSEPGRDALRALFPLHPQDESRHGCVLSGSLSNSQQHLLQHCTRGPMLSDELLMKAFTCEDIVSTTAVAATQRQRSKAVASLLSTRLARG